MTRTRIELEEDLSWLEDCPHDQLISAAKYLLLKRSVGNDAKYFKLVVAGQLPRFVEEGLVQLASHARTTRERGGLHGGYELSDLTDVVWDDLARTRSKPFGVLLRKFIKHENVAVRCEASHRLAWLAFEQDARLLVASARREWRVAESVLLGFKLALRFRRPSKQFLKSMDELAREIVAGTLHPKIGYELSSAIDVIRATDPANANKFLLSEACLFGKNARLRNILLQFSFDRQEGKRTPLIEPALLWTVYEDLVRQIRRAGVQPGVGEDDVQGMLLIEGVRTDPHRARVEINKIPPTKGKDKSMLHFQVGEARKMLRGIANPHAVIARAEKRMSKLSKKARSVLLAKQCGEDLYNDSLESYLEAYAADCESACEGLRLMGLSKYANTLRRCHAAYVAGGKLINLETFVSELPAALRREVRTLERNGHAIINAALDYAEKHAKEFK